MTSINSQDTLKINKNDSITEEYNDSVKIKQDFYDIRIEQNEINNEMKRQLNYLEEFINRGEEDPK
jgi:hypothetical protein